MVVDTNKQESVVKETEPKLDPQSTVVEDNKPQTKEEPEKEINFNDLSPEIQKFIDRERTRASKTARENALKDPKVIEKVKKEVEEEASLSVEEKYQKKLEELSMYENKLSATETLRANGLGSENISDIIDLLVSPDKDKTMANTQKFVELFNSVVEKNVSTKIQKNLKETFKPKTSVVTSKPFKEMSYAERLELKQTNPDLFRQEMDKSRIKY